MKKEKSDKKHMVWPVLAIVAIVAIVAVVMLVMNFKGSSSEVGVSEEKGALAGQATATTGDLEITSNPSGRFGSVNLKGTVFRCSDSICRGPLTFVVSRLTPFTLSNIAPGFYRIYYYRGSEYKYGLLKEVRANQKTTVSYTFPCVDSDGGENVTTLGVIFSSRPEPYVLFEPVPYNSNGLVPVINASGNYIADVYDEYHSNELICDPQDIVRLRGVFCGRGLSSGGICTGSCNPGIDVANTMYCGTTDDDHPYTIPQYCRPDGHSYYKMYESAIVPDSNCPTGQYCYTRNHVCVNS